AGGVPAVRLCDRAAISGTGAAARRAGRAAVVAAVSAGAGRHRGLCRQEQAALGLDHSVRTRRLIATDFKKAKAGEENPMTSSNLAKAAASAASSAANP